MKIPLLDLQSQFNSIEVEVRSAIDSVLLHHRYIMGPEVQEFENNIKQYCHVDHAIACASGSDALLLALMATNVGNGDYVITTPYTFFATAGAIWRLGAIPLFVDINPETYNIDPNCVEVVFAGKDLYGSRFTVHGSRIKAIIPVHLYGQMADMVPLMEIARRYGVKVIEDAAQAIGAACHEKRAGSVGDFGCFSFFPSKNLGCMGDGGAVTTGDQDLAEKVSVLRVHGSKPKYYHAMVGLNSRLDTIQAAILNVKLKILDDWIEKRRNNAHLYNEYFRKAGMTEEVRVPVERDGYYHVYNQYVIRVKRRNELRNALREKGIGTEIYYPVPLHLQECFVSLGYRRGDFPCAEEAAEQTLALPVYPELTEEMIKYVVDTIIRFYKHTS